MKRNTTLLVYFYFLKLIRIPNLIILALSQWAVAFLLLSDDMMQTLYDPNLHLLVFCSVLVGAAGYIINDYYDIKIDWVNKPQRVVISRFIERRYALILHSVFNFMALVLSLFIGWKILISIMITEVLLWWYSNDLKRLSFWGNFSVSLMTAYAILLPGLLMGKFTEPLWFFAGFAFLISFVRELIKDVEDLDGDQKYGCKTLAINIGVVGVKRLIYFLLMLLGGGLTVFVLRFSNQSLMLYSALVLGPILVVLFVKTITARNTADFSTLSTICKFTMLAGMTAMIFK